MCRSLKMCQAQIINVSFSLTVSRSLRIVSFTLKMPHSVKTVSFSLKVSPSILKCLISLGNGQYLWQIGVLTFQPGQRKILANLTFRVRKQVDDTTYFQWQG